MNWQQDQELAEFQIAVEQLEVARDLLTSNSHVKHRVALIVVDNVAEVLMLRLCKEQFTEDDAFASFKKPSIPWFRRDSILSYFDEKVRFCRRVLKEIDSAAASIFKIAHSYRNLAFHNDSHNETTTRMLATIAFVAASDLLESIYKSKGISYGGDDWPELRWVSRYGVALDQCVHVATAARQVCSVLRAGIEVDLIAAKEVFALDIADRCTALQKLLFSDYPRMTNADINGILAHCEFQETEAAERNRLSEPLWQLNYKIAGGRQDEVDKQKYWQLKEETDEKLRQIRDSFLPKTRWESLGKLAKSDERIRKTTTLDELLVVYYQADRQLSNLERYAVQARNEMDSYVQMQIDEARGK